MEMHMTARNHTDLIWSAFVKGIVPVLALVLLLLFVNACGDDDKKNPAAPNNPPTEPVNNVVAGSPADGATGVSREPILRWTSSDPDGDQIYYDVYFGTELGPPIIAGNLSDPLFAPLTELGYGVTYYWRVVAEDKRGEETSSPIWRFTTVGLDR